MLKRVGHILVCLLVFIVGILCALVIGDDGGMISDSIKSLKVKD